MKKKKLLKKLIETLQADAARMRQERADVHDEEKREEEAARDQSSRMFQLLTALLPTVLPILAPSLSGHGGRPCGCARSGHGQGEISPDAMRDIVDHAFRDATRGKSTDSETAEPAGSAESARSELSVLLSELNESMTVSQIDQIRTVLSSRQQAIMAEIGRIALDADRHPSAS